MPHLPLQWCSHLPCPLLNTTSCTGSQCPTVLSVPNSTRAQCTLKMLTELLGLLFRSAAYGLAVASIAAIAGQNCVRKLTNWLGRTSVIIFILASMILISALTLGTITRRNHTKGAAEIWNYSNIFSICRWCRHCKHSAQDGATPEHGIWKSVQVCCLGDKQGNKK